MRRNLLWLVMLLGFASYLGRPQLHEVRAHGICPGMTDAQIRARLGEPEYHQPTLAHPVDWDYEKLQLGIDFSPEGGQPRAVWVYSQILEVDNSIVLARGAAASEVRRLLGVPEIDHLDWLRFQVTFGLLDVGLERRTQQVEWFRLRRAYRIKRTD